MLNERERRILADIESHLVRQDRRFAARMRQQRRTRIKVFLLIVLLAWWLGATPALAVLWDVVAAAAGVTALITLVWLAVTPSQ